MEAYYEKFHKILMGVESKSKYCVDHINRNKNDNRKSNLRICRHKENDRNNNLYKNNISVCHMMKEEINGYQEYVLTERVLFWVIIQKKMMPSNQD